MARPQKEGMDYFPHDTDAVNDEKIEALRMLYGNDGYAFYFILLERIYRTKHFELDVSDAETIQILANKIGINAEKFNSMLETCFKRGCFDRQAYEENGVLTSEGIKKRSGVVVKKRESMRKQYKEEVSDAEIPQKPDKEKERKAKESKGNKKDYSSEFESFWKLYPRKVKKHESFKKFDKALKDEGLDEILKGVEGYIVDIEQNGTQEQYIMHPSTFLNQKAYKDYLEVEEDEEPFELNITDEQRIRFRMNELDGVLSLGENYFKSRDNAEEYYAAVKEYDELERQLQTYQK